MSSVADQAADVVEAIGGILQQQRVGALVDRDACRAWRAATPLALRLDQRGQIGGLGVVDLQVLGTQRRELLHVLARGQLGLLARGELFGRRHDDDVVVAALVEALGAQDDVERLVPRHVLQAQRDAALHRVADTTMFWPLASASSCSTARVSMSWKFSVRRSPV